MKKIPLRGRLTLITCILLSACCLCITLCVMNSAVMKLDAIGDGVLSIEAADSTDMILNINIADLFPAVKEQIAAAKKDVLVQSIMVAVCVIVSGSLITWILSKFALRPLRELSVKVSETTEKNLQEKLEVPEAKDEIRQLTESFNSMTARLDSAFLNQKQFSANTAHELRTPLAVMQTSLEVFRKKAVKEKEDYERVVDTTLTQVERMNHLVSTLLEFQSMHTAPLNDRVSLFELADEVLCDLSTIADHRNIELIMNENADTCEAYVKGNEVLLYRAIYNLVENAIKYNRDGGKVEVSVVKTTGICVMIRDNGIGIPIDKQDKVFDAFYRVDKSRSRKSGGAGLGLAMVCEIAGLHNGKVYIKESNENGTVICFEMNCY